MNRYAAIAVMLVASVPSCVDEPHVLVHEPTTCANDGQYVCGHGQKAVCCDNGDWCISFDAHQPNEVWLCQGNGR